MRIVGAEVAGLDPGGEIAAERGNDYRDLVDGFLDSLGDCGTRPFGLRAAESDGQGDHYITYKTLRNCKRSVKSLNG
ncbi:MAG: hypothetical protein DME54_05835 [Verrucomicrobia bacterium]|nr:MAG: hypothetical protein DME62_08845 [Verrucomicrobiota bacterium]PYK35130.1 MAG: hypothetical protein DME54_05835 [Verrucomicrobiota bacterium]PYL21124.1 MAG: hypothetical protein DMF41_03685 [Verrucomicrobiota bacterium]